MKEYFSLPYITGTASAATLVRQFEMVKWEGGERVVIVAPAEKGWVMHIRAPSLSLRCFNRCRFADVVMLGANATPAENKK